MFALRQHQTAEGDVEQEGGDAEKDERHRNRHHFLLLELVFQEAVRRLVPALYSANGAIRLKQLVKILRQRWQEFFMWVFAC